MRTNDIYGWIYFLECDVTKRVKIGFCASHPANRLMDLQTGSPTKLRIVRAIRGNLAVERCLHAFFHPVRLHREWFAPCPELDRVMECIQDIPEGSSRDSIWMEITRAELQKFIEFSRGKWGEDARLTVPVPPELLPSQAFQEIV